MKKNCLVLLILMMTIHYPIYSQHYDGVNMTRIKGRNYKSTELKDHYHQLAFGLNLPRSMNFGNDLYWFDNYVKGDHTHLAFPALQIAYSYHWKKWMLSAMYMYERVLLSYFDPSIASFRNNELVIRSTFTFGLSYKWLRTDRFECYSGLGMGFSVQEREYTAAWDYSEGNGTIQLIALGMNYKINKFGIFAEAGYGTKGLLFAGINYRF